MSEVTVSIFSHNYRLAVSTGEEELIQNCAEIVDKQMEAMRAGGRVLAADQIAVLSALEIVYNAKKAEEAAAQAVNAARTEGESARADIAAARSEADALRAELESTRASAAAAQAELATLRQTAEAQPFVRPLQQEPIPQAAPSLSNEAEIVARIQELSRMCEEAIFQDTKLGSLF